MRSVKTVASAATLLLAACSSMQPIQQDQPTLLAKGNGLAAVVMNTKDPLTEVFIRPAGSGGTGMEIPSVPVGRTLYLFEVEAGTYCFQQFHYGSILFFGQGAALACFVVPAGQIGYSGDLMPRAENGKVYIHQDYDSGSFLALLQRDYPKIATQFAPPPSVLPAPAAPSPQTTPPSMPVAAQKPNCNLQTCTWSEPIAGTQSQAIYIKNKTRWMIRITILQLYDCVNIKEACSTRQVSIKVPAHASKQVMVVNPADPAGAYAYYFRFEYRIDLSGRN